MKRPMIKDQRVAIATGAALLVAGFAVLYDAWDGRGKKKPLLLGPILPW